MARGIIGMMFLLLAFQVITFTIHKCSRGQDDRSSPPLADRESDARNRQAKLSAQLFPFNPNTVPLDSLTLLGFSVKQAQTIIRYREKGGRFRRREDFAKIYTVSPQMYNRLAPYISISPPAAQTSNNLKHKENKNNIMGEKSGERKDQVRQDGQARQSGGQAKQAQQKSGYRETWSVQVDLNEADSAALIEVKGIGPYFCKKILELRERLGSFANTSQLLEIKGMDEEKFERIKGQVFVHPSGIKRFKLTEADKKFLARHPYIGAYNARGIALFIEAMGKESCTLSNLVRNNILSPEAAEKLKPYVIEP